MSIFSYIVYLTEFIGIMLTETMIVRSSSQTSFGLQSINGTSCKSCNLKPSCGQYILNSLHRDREILFPRSLFSSLSDKNNLPELKIGSQVQVEIPSRNLVQLSLLLYSVPLIAMLLFALLASLFKLNEIYSVVLVFFSLFLSFYFLNKYSMKNKPVDLLMMSEQTGP